MYREIKFRGKTKSDGLWEFGSLLIENDKYYIYGTDNNWWEVIPETIGQYTGHKDIKGKEIYEGDILERVFRGEKRIFVCSWDVDNYAFKFKDIKYPNTYHCSLEYDTVVIGNIHDNPKLGELNG